MTSEKASPPENFVLPPGTTYVIKKVREHKGKYTSLIKSAIRIDYELNKWSQGKNKSKLFVYNQNYLNDRYNLDEFLAYNKFAGFEFLLCIAENVQKPKTRTFLRPEINNPSKLYEFWNWYYEREEAISHGNANNFGNFRNYNILYTFQIDLNVLLCDRLMPIKVIS